MRKGLLPLLLALALASCGEDDTVSPPYRMDFLDIHTNSSGEGFQAVKDDDGVFSLVRPVQGLEKDTVIRCIAVYTQDGNAIRLHQTSRVLCAEPRSSEEADEGHTDPVKVQSVWKTSRYINCTLQVPRKDKKHTFGIIYQGTTVGSGGNRTAHILLSHDAHDDTKAFTGVSYLSVPLKAFSTSLTPGQDSILLSIHTLSQGIATYGFPL